MSYDHKNSTKAWWVYLLVIMFFVAGSAVDGGDLDVEYGSAHIHRHGGATWAVAASNTTYNTTGWTSYYNKDVTFASDKWTITTAGIYKFDYSISFAGGTGSTYDFGIGVNGHENDTAHAHRKIGTGGDIGNAGATGVINLQEGDIITMTYRDEKNPPQDITIDSANIVFWRID